MVLGCEKFTDVKFVVKSVVAVSISFCFPEYKKDENPINSTTILCTELRLFKQFSNANILLDFSGMQ